MYKINFHSKEKTSSEKSRLKILEWPYSRVITTTNASDDALETETLIHYW
jgi:hypothetical protein